MSKNSIPQTPGYYTRGLFSPFPSGTFGGQLNSVPPTAQTPELNLTSNGFFANMQSTATSRNTCNHRQIQFKLPATHATCTICGANLKITRLHPLTK